MPVPDRNSTVDTLRTAALIGICVVNLPFMGLPQGAVLTAPDGLWNQAAALFTGIFFEAKFFMLFSFLFGWGIEIQQRSAERAGASAGRRYGRRLVMLALFGIYGLIVRPITGIYKFLKVPGRRDEVKSLNMTITGVVVALVVAAICFIPLPQRWGQ